MSEIDTTSRADVSDGAHTRETNFPCPGSPAAP